MTSNSALPPNHCLDAIAVKLAQEDLAPGKSVSGQPRVGTLTLGQIGYHSVGIWEISPSVSTDVETDETFIVLSGEATVTFADGTAPLHLRAGSVGRFAASTATTWTVTKTLRKVYIA